jgi:hypothetical protein
MALTRDDRIERQNNLAEPCRCSPNPQLAQRFKDESPRIVMPTMHWVNHVGRDLLRRGFCGDNSVAKTSTVKIHRYAPSFSDICIAHNSIFNSSRVKLQNLVALELTSAGRNSMPSLPDGISRLTRLEELQVYFFLDPTGFQFFTSCPTPCPIVSKYN